MTKSTTGLSWRCATALLCVVIAGWGALALGQAATWPNCSFNCTANDVAMTSAYLDLLPGSCEPGSMISAPLMGVFRANATRYAVFILADVYINGQFSGSLLQCVANSVNPPGGTFELAVISWPCGALLELRNLIVSWAASVATCADTPKCSERGAKCSKPGLGGIVVTTPLVVDFASNSPRCFGTPISFTSSTTGGTTPYAYAWDFGDGGTSGAANPTHLYSTAGTYTVTLTVRDAAGSTDSHSYSVTVLPVPTASAGNGGPYCVGQTIQLSASGGGSYSWTGPGGFTSTQQNPTIPSASAAKAGTYTVTVSASGCTAQASTTVVVDSTPPVLVVPTNRTVTCGSSTDPTATGQATATDSLDPSPTVTSSDVSSLSGCGGTGTITRTWKATDACGNVATGVQTITVADTTAPSLTVPASISVECGHSTEPSATGQALATDACGTATLSHSDAAFLTGCNGTGTITRTWRAVDACGNVATGVQTITVADTTPPSLTLPANLAVDCGHSTDPSATGQATATEACGAATITYSDAASLLGCNGTGTITRTWRAVDGCGNVATGLQTITVVDVIPPSLTVPADATVQSGHPSDPSATGQASAIDNCTLSPLVTYSDQDHLSGPGGSGTITRTWTATDACGNATVGVQTITVTDVTPPPVLVLRVPPDITVGTEDPTDPSATGQATASDTCPTPPTLSYSDQPNLTGCDGTGTILRTWTATDACGSVARGVQTITVADTVFPVLTVPADVAVDCGEPTDPSATGTATATDPHGDEEYSISVTYTDQVDRSGCGATGTILRTWEATEACGNSVTGMQTITVVDRTPPTLTVPANVTVDPGESTAPAATGTAQATDSCSAVTVSYADQSDLSGCEGTGTITRTWKATDACGNVAAGVQAIIVADTTLPMLTVPADVTVECGQSTDPFATGRATASDPHADEESSATVTYADLTEFSDCGGTGKILRTWEATEACGNSVAATQTIAIVDTTAPRLVLPSNATVECGGSTRPLATGTATATDACTVSPTLTYSDVWSSTGCSGTGTVTRTWQATDACGNASAAAQTIAVVDTTPPAAADDGAAISEDSTALISVLANDSDACDDAPAMVSVGVPLFGTAVVAGEQVEYAPPSDFNGIDTFMYAIEDCSGNVASALVRVTVLPVNDPPVAGDDTASVAEDGSAVINVPGNDSDPDGNLNLGSVSIVDPPDHGTVSVNPVTGQVTYEPGPNFNGTDTFTYEICDSSGLCDTASVTVSVTAVNDPPVANDDSTSTPEDTQVVVLVIDNDFDVDGNLDPTTVTITSTPSNGTASVDPVTGAVTYVPAPHFNGTDTFSYQVCDTGGLCDTATVRVNVGPTDDPPVATDDTGTVFEDGVTTIDVVANDRDPDGNLDPTTVVVVAPPAHGTYSVDPVTGAITYAPDENYSGIDTLTYQVCDTDGECDTAVVTITVLPVDDAPVARDDSASTPEDTPVVVNVPGNDFDPDGNLTLGSVSIVDPPDHGTVTVNPVTGAVTYEPDPNFNGTDTFSYEICDSVGVCDTASVTVSVTSVNDPPVAGCFGAVVVEGVVTQIQLRGSDSEGGPLTYRIVAGPEDGTIAGFDEEEGSFFYSSRDCLERAVAIHVGEDAEQGLINTRPGESVRITLSGGEPAVATVIVPPAHGTAEVNRVAGALLYVPDDGFTGTDGLSYVSCPTDDPGYVGPVSIVYEVVDASGARDRCVVQLFVVAAAGGGGTGECDRRVVISEIAWAGTKADPAHEWIELRNLEDEPVDLSGWTLRWRRKQPETEEEQLWKAIALTGEIAPYRLDVGFEFRPNDGQPGTWWGLRAPVEEGGFFLLGRETDEVIHDVSADLVYDEQLPLDRIADLDDRGDVLQLVDPFGCIVDTANADHPERGGWAAGDLQTTGTMERTDLFRDDLDENWHANLGLWSRGIDSGGGLVLGTARRENSPLLEDVQQDLTAGPIQLARGGALRLALPAAPQGEGVPATLWALLSRPGEAEVVAVAAVVTPTAAGVSVEIDTSTLPLGRSFLWLRYGGGDVLLVPLELTK